MVISFVLGHDISESQVEITVEFRINWTSLETWSLIFKFLTHTRTTERKWGSQFEKKTVGKQEIKLSFWSISFF